jgi:hypothetical protein
MEQTRLQRSN